MRKMMRWLKGVGLGGIFLLVGCNNGNLDPTVGAGKNAPPSALARGRLDFVTSDLNAGMRLATEEGKPLLIFFTASWCHFCHEMANETFTNNQVVNLSKQFVCVIVDADAQKDVVQQFQVRGFPTIQFVSPRGLPLNKLVGKRPVSDLLQQMQAALQAMAAAANHPEIQRL